MITEVFSVIKIEEDNSMLIIEEIVSDVMIIEEDISVLIL